LPLSQVRAWFLLPAVRISSLPLLSATFVANTRQSVCKHVAASIFLKRWKQKKIRRWQISEPSRFSFTRKNAYVALVLPYKNYSCRPPSVHEYFLFFYLGKCFRWNLWPNNALSISHETYTYHFVFLRLYDMHANWILVEWANRHVTFG
jgi:hypothetical protein